MKACSGTHKDFRLLQDGRIYIMQSGQTLYLGQKKSDHHGPTELAALPVVSDEAIALIDPDPEDFVEELVMTHRNPKFAK